MNNYDGLFIIKPDLKEEELKSLFKTIGDLVAKNGGSVNKEEPWGKRQLAYPVKKRREGHYYKLSFASPPAGISKMEAAYRLNPDILRAMITRR